MAGTVESAITDRLALLGEVEMEKGTFLSLSDALRSSARFSKSAFGATVVSRSAFIWTCVASSS